LSGGTVMNDAGQVAFIADLSDTVNGAAAGRGVFFYDDAGGLQQVAAPATRCSAARFRPCSSSAWSTPQARSLPT